VDAETIFLLAQELKGAVVVTAVPGAPTTGTWFTGNLVLDSNGVLWLCEAGGTPGTWVSASTPWLTPISKSASYAAANGQVVEMTATGTVTSPAAADGARFGASVNYAATNASPVTVTAATGFLTGPGIPASTTSILLGANNANVVFVSDGTNWYLSAGAQDSGWIVPSLGNSWTTGAGGSGHQAQYRLTGNVVRLAGYLTGGSSGTTAWTLPSGYHPVSPFLLALSGAGNGSSLVNFYVSVSYTGVVQPVFSGTLSNLYLDGLSFTVD
jgi:hypothetical protein